MRNNHETSDGYQATAKNPHAGLTRVHRTKPLSPSSADYLDSLRGCSVRWLLEDKLRRLDRENIQVDDAVEALHRGYLERDPSNKRRFKASRGRLVVVFEPLRTCNV